MIIMQVLRFININGLLVLSIHIFVCYSLLTALLASPRIPLYSTSFQFYANNISMSSPKR